MHRFVANQLEENYFILAEDDVKQIKQVLRLRNQNPNYLYL